ncbi:MAG: hypothetical protein KGY81_10490, partial [Phycisphaerae bacterium]|nr:hypothetical protein [Phycisphaerae bacterium]
MKLRTVVLIVRTLGVRWTAFRVKYALRQRLGMIRRSLPVGTWEDYTLPRIVSDPTLVDADSYAAHRSQQSGRFFFKATDRQVLSPMLCDLDDNSDWPARRLEQIASGKLRYFSGQAYDIGWPPRWHTNAMTGQVAPADVHFSQIDEFDYGDVKVIWEPNRFGFVYDLARIAWRGDDDRVDRCAAMFWAAVEDWA